MKLSVPRNLFWGGGAFGPDGADLRRLMKTLRGSDVTCGTSQVPYKVWAKGQVKLHVRGEDEK